MLSNCIWTRLPGAGAGGRTAGGALLMVGVGTEGRTGGADEAPGAGIGAPSGLRNGRAGTRGGPTDGIADGSGEGALGWGDVSAPGSTGEGLVGPDGVADDGKPEFLLSCGVSSGRASEEGPDGDGSWAIRSPIAVVHAGLPWGCN
jgi:hypothetical protein